MVDPARLAWGLKRVALELGVRIHEATPRHRSRVDRLGVRLGTPAGHIDARRVVLGTNGFTPLVRSIRRYVVPVYDYVLVTEPLSRAQRDAIGWAERQGFADSTNHFHYFRTTEDGRILWGGYDAIYHFAQWRAARVRTARRHVLVAGPAVLRHVPAARRASVLASMGRRDRHVQPVLGDVRHGAGRRRSPTRSGTPAWAWRPRGSVPARRWTWWTGVTPNAPACGSCGPSRSRSLPNRCGGPGIHLTTRALTRADEREGRRGPWLRLLDSVGLGFDS